MSQGWKGVSASVGGLGVYRMYKKNYRDILKFFLYISTIPRALNVGLQQHRVVLCKGTPLWPLTCFSGERSKVVWALLFSHLECILYRCHLRRKQFPGYGIWVFCITFQEISSFWLAHLRNQPPIVFWVFLTNFSV